MDSINLAVCVLATLLIARRWWSVPIVVLISLASGLAIETSIRAILGEQPFAYLHFILREPIGYWAFTAGVLFICATVVFGLKRTFIWALFGEARPLYRVAAGLLTLSILCLMIFAYTITYWRSLLPRRVVQWTVETFVEPPRCKLDSARPVPGLPEFNGLASPLAKPLPSADMGLSAVHTTEMSVEHLLSRVPVIRATYPSRYRRHRAIALRIAIDERGEVFGATPITGPSVLFPRAIESVSRLKFLPFVRDGQAVPVRLERMSVPIARPARVRPDRVPFPDFRDRASTIVRLSDWSRGFSIEIRGDGRVSFQGGRETAVQGLHCGVISSRSIDALIREIERSEYFSMPGYIMIAREAQNKSAPSLYVALDDHEKSVQTGSGNSDDTPDALWDVVDAILEAAQAARWINGNRFTAPSLAAERWDFSRRNSDNESLLPRVARTGDLEAVKGLLAAGAPVHEKVEAQYHDLPNVKLPLYWSGVNALEAAAERGAFDIFAVLLETKTQWSAQTLGAARVWAIEHGNLDLAAHLLSRGADPLAKTHTGKTALMAAAAAGRPDLVGEMLAAGLDVHARDENKLTALHWAAAVDYPKVVDSAKANRRKAIDILVRAGAEVDARGNEGWTPLNGNWQGLDDVTAALIVHRANVNASDDEGNTPLMNNKSAAAVKRLLNAGADPYQRNGKGQNALDVAREDIFAADIALVIERWMASHPQRPAPTPPLRSKPD